MPSVCTKNNNAEARGAPPRRQILLLCRAADVTFARSSASSFAVHHPRLVGMSGPDLEDLNLNLPGTGGFGTSHTPRSAHRIAHLHTAAGRSAPMRLSADTQLRCASGGSRAVTPC